MKRLILTLTAIGIAIVLQAQDGETPPVTLQLGDASRQGSLQRTTDGAYYTHETVTTNSTFTLTWKRM